ncbi:MAG: hypothetical protein SF097_27265 [Acidobacteriota bacterium]|nr:hypothetical protein [Acidobacteriota bacterium]
MNSFDSFTLVPMSAGDIIDRAVRIYRRNFLPLLRIVFGPSLVAYIGTVMYYAGLRNFSLERGEGRVAVSISLIVVGFIIWLFGKAAFYAVLGGASRSLVDHFFERKPILAKDVYRAVRERFWSLIGAMVMVGLLLAGAGAIVYFIVIIAMLIAVAAAALLSTAPNFLQMALAAGYTVLIGIGVLLIFLLVYSRVVYVPQVMMVEGKNVFSSISRSFSLAGGEMWRVAALVLFWFYVAWSAWWLLFSPLGSLAYWLGINLSPFNQDIPFWFNIANQTVTQISEIAIAPIAMLGFTLLYLDSRVRKEGFDIELMANRLLPPTQEMMRMASQSNGAVFGSPLTVQESFSGVPSILGLNNYSPNTEMPPPEAAPPAQHDFPGVAAAVVEPSPSSFVGEQTMTEESAPTVAGLATAEPNDSAAEPAATANRFCRWCGTASGDEDRFCRVCGSVF